MVRVPNVPIVPDVENMIFTAETQSSQRSEYFVIKSSLLRVLSASAVKSPALSPHRRRLRGELSLSLIFVDLDG